MANSQVLRRLDYPAYCIKLLDNGLVALAGGGGTAKTGVGNSLELGFVSYVNQLAEFKQIHAFQCEDAIMKFVSFTLERPHSKSETKITDLYLAAAVNQTIEIFQVQPCLNKTTETKTKLEPSASIKLVGKITLADSSSTHSITNIQIYKNSKKVLLVFGTEKGSIHVYKLLREQNNNITDNKLNFEKVHEFSDAHANEIDELQVNSDGLMLSVAKDKCFVWSLETLRKISEFRYSNFVNDSNIRLKHARFSKDSKNLYLTYVTRIRSPRNLKSYIQRWTKVVDASKEDGMNYRLEKTIRLTNTILTCVQSSKDGLFVSAGDCHGKVYLYDYELNKLEDFKQQHTNVVTDLCFYYDEEFDVKNVKKFDLNKLILTISIDRTLQLYKFLNTNLTKHFMNTVNRQVMNSSLSNFCLMSMNCFKFFVILSLVFLFICYFFVHFET